MSPFLSFCPRSHLDVLSSNLVDFFKYLHIGYIHINFEVNPTKNRRFMGQEVGKAGLCLQHERYGF